MAENLTVESPDFDRIERGDDRATRDAIELLWRVINDEAKARRRNDKTIRDRIEPAEVTFNFSAGQDDLDVQGATLLVSEGASNVTVTGMRAGVEGRIVIWLVLGTGTITLAHQSASSEAGNRMAFRSAGNLAVATDRAAMLIYRNSRWREANWILT